MARRKVRVKPPEEPQVVPPANEVVGEDAASGSEPTEGTQADSPVPSVESVDRGAADDAKPAEEPQVEKSPATPTSSPVVRYACVTMVTGFGRREMKPGTLLPNSVTEQDVKRLLEEGSVKKVTV